MITSSMAASLGDAKQNVAMRGVKGCGTLQCGVVREQLWVGSTALYHSHY